MAVLGADVADLEDLAETLLASATTLQGTADEVTSSLRVAWWEGAFADGYRQSWNSADRAALVEAADVLRELATDLTRQADQQRGASEVGGAGASPGPGGRRPMPGDGSPPGGGVPGDGGVPAGGDDDLDSLRDRIADTPLGAVLGGLWAAGQGLFDDAEAWLEEVRARQQLVEDLLALDPAEQRGLWDSLSEDERQRLLDGYPEAVMRMEGLDPEVRAAAEAEFARRRLDDVAIATSAAFLEAELDIATFEVEGAARGEYRVMGDGEVQLFLRLEGDLGREFGTAAGEAEVEVGVSGELLLNFDSAEEADAFLAGLFPAATEGFGAGDALPWNAANIPAKFGGNVYDYVMAQDVEDLRGGVYAGGSLEVEGATVDVEVSAQLEGFYDFADGQKGLRGTAAVDASFLGTGDEAVAAGRVQVAGALTLDDNNSFDQLDLSVEVGGSVPLDSLGFDLPGADGGQAATVDFSVDKDNPYATEIVQAFTSGDIGRATELAADHGQVVVTTSVVGSATSSEGEIKVLGQGVEYEYGTELSTATSVHIRPPGGDGFHQVHGAGAPGGATP